jgi:hypothetical protein
MACFVIVFAGIGVYVLISSFADSTKPIVNLETEKMTLPTGAVVIHNSQDSNGEHIRFDQDGTATASVTIPQYDSVSTISVRMAGRECNGSPSVELQVNNQTVLPTTQLKDSNWNNYNYNDNLSSGTYSVNLITSNEHFYTNSCIRAMKVDNIVFNGTTSAPPAPTLAFSASPTSIISGSSSTLTWSSTNASSCTASGSWSGNEPTSGTTSSGALTSNSTYDLSCTGIGGTVSQTASVTVASGSGGSGPNSDQPATLFDSSDGSVPYLTSTIPANPVLAPNSYSMVQTIGSNLPEVDGSGTTAYEIPIYNTNNSDPVYNPSFSETSWGCSVNGSMHIPDYATREVPDGSVGGDGWIETVNTDTGTVDSIWQASKSTGTWNGSCGGSFPLHGNGFATGEANPSEVKGVGAGAGEQIGAGLILYSELESGAINHALYMTSNDTCSAFEVPATKSDGHGSGTDCWPEGARVQLNPSVNCNGLSGASAAEIMICKTMQTYGGYVLDSGGAGPLNGIATMGDDMNDPGRSPWTTPGNPERGSANCAPISATCGVLAHYGITGGANDLAQIPWSQLRVLNSWNGS